MSRTDVRRMMHLCTYRGEERRGEERRETEYTHATYEVRSRDNLCTEDQERRGTEQ